jgi:hypothetical protein
VSDENVDSISSEACGSCGRPLGPYRLEATPSCDDDDDRAVHLHPSDAAVDFGDESLFTCIATGTGKRGGSSSTCMHQATRPTSRSTTRQ